MQKGECVQQPASRVWMHGVVCGPVCLYAMMRRRRMWRGRAECEKSQRQTTVHGKKHVQIAWKLHRQLRCPDQQWKRQSTHQAV